MAKNTINTKPLRRMPYRPKFYKHKNDARETYVDLQPTGLIVKKNGNYYAPENYAYTSVDVNVPSVIRPELKIKLTPELPYYIKGTDSLKELVISTNVTKGSHDISLIRIKIDNTVVKDFTDQVKDGGPFVYTHIFNTPQTINFSVTVEVFDIDNRRVSMTQDVKFVFPSYYGVIGGDSAVITGDQIKKLYQVVKGEKTHLFSGINSDYGKIVYAYPTDQGELYSIKDPLHGIDYTNSFTKTIVQIGDCAYYCYSLSTAASIEDVQILFN